MASCDQSAFPNPANSSSLSATSAQPPPPPCTPTTPVSPAMFFTTIIAFVVIVAASGLVIYILHRLGWFAEHEPATVQPAAAARLLVLRESASVANSSQGLDPALVRSFPVYTFRDKLADRDVTTEMTVLTSFHKISREISRSLSSSRRLSKDVSLTRCPSRNDSNTAGAELATEGAGEPGSKRSEFVVTIEGEDEAMTCRRECAVCLGEYAAGERIKVVPACAHGFHADCIDLWLAAKTTCPICRRDLTPRSLNSTDPVVPITQQGGVAEGTVGEGEGAVPAPLHVGAAAAKATAAVVRGERAPEPAVDGASAAAAVGGERAPEPVVDGASAAAAMGGETAAAVGDETAAAAAAAAGGETVAAAAATAAATAVGSEGAALADTEPVLVAEGRRGAAEVG
ncbi:unnamed protein product [Closterium sp. Yama58-4]|nr:unnamed protein product [Closterium sp. Yama58-4]